MNIRIGDESMHHRQTVSQDLLQFLQASKDVIAAWEGGSAATGFLDAYSDLDLLVICKDESVEKVLKATEEIGRASCRVRV